MVALIVKRGNYHTQAYLSTIQHLNLISHMLVADSSQTILSTLIQVFEANHGVKSALENSLWDAHYFRVFVLDE
jgi:hypothetical protein